MQGLRTFLLLVKGKSLNDNAVDNLSYRDLFNEFLSEKGEGKFSGLAPVSSFKLIESNNATISYEVAADVLRYPELKDFAERIKSAFSDNVSRRKISYNISKTTGENATDVITFSLEYAYTLSDLDSALAKRKSTLSKQIIDNYNYAKRTNNRRLQRQIELNYPDIRNQNLSIDSTRFTSEEELKQRAIEVDESQEEQEKRPEKPIETPKTPQVTVNQPIIISPGEKLTISKERESKSESTTSKEKESKDVRSFIESISNTLFDKKILQYKDMLIKSEIERPSPIQSSSIVPVQSVGTERSKDRSLKQEIANTKEASIVTNTMESVLGQNVALLPIQIPQNTTIVPSVSASDKVSNLETQINQTKETETARSNDVISFVSDSIRQVEKTIGLLSNTIKENQASVKNNVSGAISESLSFLGITPSNVTGQMEKFNESVVQSERSTSQNSSLQAMTNKVVGVDFVSPLKTELSSIIENMGSSISSAVTKVMMQDRKNAEERKTSMQPPVPKPSTSTSTSIVNEDQKYNNQLQAPSLQNFMTGNNSPSVVSLSQSTIDNLASAIIKGMSISPFLNSGRA